MFLCWLSRSPSSPIRSRMAEEACCSKTVPSPLRLNLTPRRTERQQVSRRKLHFLMPFSSFICSPSLRVEVFGSVGDVILLVSAQRSAFLVLRPIFSISLQASPFSTNYSREHLLVTTNGTTCHKLLSIIDIQGSHDSVKRLNRSLS